MAKNPLDERIKKNFLNNLIPTETLEPGAESEENQVYEIPVNDLVPFRFHTFEVDDGEEMEELVRSIKENGLLHPILVRKLENGTYEIISGHRRTYACKKAGKTSAPAIIRTMTDDQAVEYMAIANFANRKKLKHSEKAKTYSLLYEQYKHQGIKEGEQSLKRLACLVGDNAKKVQRYLRLANLNDSLLLLVNSGKLGFTSAVELAGLSKEEQSWVESFILDGVSIRNEQAKKISEAGRMGTLTQFSMTEILFQQEMRQKPGYLEFSELTDYFPQNYTEAEMKETVLSLLATWKEGRT